MFRPLHAGGDSSTRCPCQPSRHRYIDVRVESPPPGAAGGAIGPDLTAVGSRFNRHDLLEAILLPSKVVPDQFQNTVIATKDGEEHTGRVMFEDADKVVLSSNPLTPARVEIPKRSIQSRQVSKLSPMPEGLVNVLMKEEILDLLGYLEGGGSIKNPVLGK